MWWWRADKSIPCLSHTRGRLESHRCALQEGFANYVGTTVSDYLGECFEHIGTVKAPSWPVWCRVRHNKKPKDEAWIAALFLDLTDGTEEEGDYTEYPGSYVGRVFETCETRSRYGWKIHVYKWWKRTNVSNIVWCLEEEITPVYHEEDSVFGDIGRPWDVKVRLMGTKPANRSIADIRRTWLKNLNYP